MLNKSRFLRLVGFGLVIELAVIASIVVSTAAPTPSLSDALPTQMVLPIAATPLPDSQAVSVENIEAAVSNPSSTDGTVTTENTVTDEAPAIAVVPTGVPSLSKGERQTLPISGNIEPPFNGTQVVEPITPVALDPVPNQVIIQFKADAKPADINAYVASVGGTVTQQIDTLNTVVVSLPPAQAALPLPEASQIVNSEPDYFVSAQVSLPPSDPFYAQQWALPVVKAAEGWNTLPADAPQVIVAVIDSGICADHPDLQGRILPGWDFVQNDATPQDEYGHGCDIAGIIAANVDDNIGIAGVAPNAMILPLRILDAQGNGTYSNVAAAIVRAVDEGAQVINLSVGGANPSSTLENAIKYAADHDVTVVAAAGNTGGNVLYPAAYESVVAVGSVDANLQRSSFSAHLPQLDTLAPGRDILTTGHNLDYVTVSGTSFAAAEVSGIVALNLGTGHPLVFNGGVLSFGEQNGTENTPPRGTAIVENVEGEGDKVEPLAVIGLDSRTRINPTTVTPHNAIVQLDFTQNGGRYFCSGALIAPNYVLTAGHCVYEGGAYSYDIFVTPAKNGPNWIQPTPDEPYGYTMASIAYVPDTWIATNTAPCGFGCADVNYDWALLRLDSPFSSASITPFAISAYTDTFMINNITTYKNAGYPGDKCYYSSVLVTTCPSTGADTYNGVTQWGATGTIVPGLLTPYLIGTQIDSFGGQSGSPLYHTDGSSQNIITGVLSHSYNTNPSTYSCQGTPGAQCSPDDVNNFFRRVNNEMLEIIISMSVPINNPSCNTVTITVNNVNLGVVEQALPRSMGCPNGQYLTGELLSLSAIAQPGYIFTGWTGGPTGDLNTTYTVTVDATIIANFAAQPAPAPETIFERGFYDDRNNGRTQIITYNGGWTEFNGVGPSAGTLTLTGLKNAIATFSFEGDGFVIYRRKAPTRGAMEVCIDLTCQTISNTSATGEWAVPEIFNTSNAVHTVRIRNLSPSTIDVDAIQILAPTAPLSAGIYQETEPDLTFIGKWTTAGGRSYTNDPNGRVRFNIDSSVRRISISRTVYQAGVYGSLQVFVDDVLTATIPNNPSAAFMYNVPYMLSVIPGNHRIELRNVGSTYSDIDQIKLLGVSNELSTGTYENTHDDLTYSGNWILSGNRTYTNDANGRVSFKINNTVGRVTINRTIYQMGVYGSLQVFVDGVLNTTIANNTSSTFQYGQPFTFTVAPGSHIIELRNVGSTYSDVDSIVLQAPTAALNTGIYEDTEIGFITYSGKWTTAGGRTYTNDPNGRAAFNIDGSVGRVIIYRTLYQAGVYGSLQVFVDDVLTTVIPSTPSATFQYGVPFSFTVIPGNHRIELRNIGSTYADIDRIEVQAPPTALVASPGTGIYEDTSPNLTYTGNWTSQTNNVNFAGNSRKFTNDPNGRVSFTIDNTVGRVTIKRTIFQPGVYGSLQVFVDGVLNVRIANDTSSTFQYQQDFTFTVTPGNHVIELRNISATYSDIDQIIVREPTAPLNTLTTGIYEDTDLTHLTYTGKWTPQANGNALGGNRTFTNDMNGRVAFNINDTVGRVTIYRTIYQNGVYGSLQVFVDGVLITTINSNTSATFLYGQPFILNVAPGNHRIELRNVGSTYSDIDRIVVQAPPVALTAGTGTYEDTSANLNYIGTWTTAGSRTYTNDPNGRVSFNVDNTVGRITINRTIFQAGVYGSLQVFVDGVLNVTIANNTSSTFLYQQPFTFTVTPGNHVIELRNVGTTYSDVDQIVVAAPTNPMNTTTGTYEDTETAFITYTGKWTPAGNRTFTNDPNGRAAFNINNSVGHVIIYRTIYQNGVYGSLQVFVDGVLNTTIANNTSATFQYGVPFILNVTPGNHRIELRNVGATYSDIERIVVQAPGSLSLPVATLPVRPTLEPTATLTPTLVDVTATLGTPTATATFAETATVEPTQTLVPTDVPTQTPLPTDAPTQTLVPTDVPTQTPLPTDVPTQTLVPTDVPTQTPLPTDVPTATALPTETPSETPP